MLLSTIRRLHRSEQGAMSLISVFTLVVLMFLLGMVMNSTLELDQRVKMQNAADSVTHAGGMVFTRNLNTIGFTNHLLADVFSLTAFMREARDRKAEQLTLEILDNWERIGHVLRGSPYEPFNMLGIAIGENIPPDRVLQGERNMVYRFGEWAAAGSELMLPVFETILAERQIPEFQRSLVLATPELMDLAADHMARRHSEAWPQQTRLHGRMWRTSGVSVQNDTGNDPATRVLPVIDTVLDALPEGSNHRQQAERMRFTYSHRYLRRWDDVSMSVFDRFGRMSQFGALWRIITCGELANLLEENANINLPMVLRHTRSEMTRTLTEREFMFVGTVYREQRQNLITGVFTHPNQSPMMAYAQQYTFVPRRRLIYVWIDPTRSTVPETGIPGQNVPLPQSPEPTDGGGDDEDRIRIVVRQNGSWHNESWATDNQNWTTQLTPATAENIPTILSTQPTGLSEDFNLLPWSQLDPGDLRWLSHH